MTKEQFELKYRGEKVAVHCDTEEKAKTFLKLAKSFGYKWDSGKDLEKTSHWEDEKEHTCYRFYETFVLTSPKGFYQQNGYKIVEFELEKETTKENDMKFKVGQKVRVKTDLKSDNHYDGILFNKDMESVVGKVFTIGSIPFKNIYKLSDFAHPNFFWSAEMLEPVEELEDCNKLYEKLLAYINKSELLKKDVARYFDLLENYEDYTNEFIELGNKLSKVGKKE